MYNVQVLFQTHREDHDAVHIHECRRFLNIDRIIPMSRWSMHYAFSVPESTHSRLPCLWCDVDVILSGLRSAISSCHIRNGRAALKICEFRLTIPNRRPFASLGALPGRSQRSDFCGRYIIGANRTSSAQIGLMILNSTG